MIRQIVTGGSQIVDRRVTVRNIVVEIETGHNAIQEILNKLGYSEVCVRWVPRYPASRQCTIAHCSSHYRCNCCERMVCFATAYSPNLAPLACHLFGLNLIHQKFDPRGRSLTIMSLRRWPWRRGSDSAHTNSPRKDLETGELDEKIRARLGKAHKIDTSNLVCT